MRILFIADPIDKLKPATDSSLALLRGSLEKQWENFWANGQSVEFVGDGVGVWAEKVSHSPVGGLPSLEKKQWHPINAFDAVLIRKDPPFDSDYVKLCWLLLLAEKKVFMMNRPSLLLRYHEKLVPLEARAQGFLEKEDVIPTHIGSHEAAKSFVDTLKVAKVITKPFLGFGGGNIALHSRQEFHETKPSQVNDSLVQPFKEEVTKFGDRRVFFLAGELLAHFVRMPKEGGFVSNLAQGGSAVLSPLSPREVLVTEKLGRFLKATGIAFAGADLIGHLVSEVNLTSPTGLMALEKLEQKSYVGPILDFVEKQIKLFRP